MQCYWVRILQGLYEVMVAQEAWASTQEASLSTQETSKEELDPHWKKILVGFSSMKERKCKILPTELCEFHYVLMLRLCSNLLKLLCHKLWLSTFVLFVMFSHVLWYHYFHKFVWSWDVTLTRETQSTSEFVHMEVSYKIWLCIQFFCLIVWIGFWTHVVTLISMNYVINSWN